MRSTAPPLPLKHLLTRCSKQAACRLFDEMPHRITTCNTLHSIARNSLLSGHREAYSSMRASATRPDQFAFAVALSACARTADILYGTLLYCDLLKTGFGSSTFCEGALIDMYAKCGRVADARQVFDGVGNPDTISWTNIIAAYARTGAFDEALRLYARMLDSDCTPDQVTCVTVISAFMGLGRLRDARSVFDKMSDPNAVAWNAIISGHSQNAHEDEALRFYQEMRGTGVKPTRSTLGSVLSAAANLSAQFEGQQVHSDAVRLGLDSNVFVGSSLINMYAKCGSVGDARRVFDALDERNTVIWNAMLGGYVQNRQPERVAELFLAMKGLGFQIDEYTFVSVFGACASLENLDFGRQLHCVVIKRQLDGSLFVGNALIDMYAKCGDLNGARGQFELVRNRDNISWNAIIVGQVHNEEEEEALNLFQRMRRDSVMMPDEVSFASVISACSGIQAFVEGKQIHCLSIKTNHSSGLYVGSSLIDLYAKLKDMDAANLVYLEMTVRGVVARNVLIAGHVQNNNTEKALSVFRQMQAECVEPSHVTFASILPACVGPFGITMGRQLHCRILKSGLPYNDAFVGVSLLGMYLKSKTLDDANKLFMEMPECKSLVLWTSFISGHAQNGYSEDALLLFKRMRSYNLWPDQATFVSILRSCADLAALKDGKEIHGLIIQTGFASDEYTSSALVDMYSKCGDVRASLQVFQELDNKADAISWNSLIVGFAKNGYAEEALLLFHQMQHSQAKPDDITLLGVLTACSHAGLVSEGRGFFESIPKKYGVTPRVDHYASIVDLLGRAGYLKEAVKFIDRLPFEPDGVIWATLLAACKIHGDWERGQHAAEELIKLEPHNSSPYVLLSGLYAASGNWAGAKMVRELMRERGVRKSPGCSWIAVGNKTSLFVAGDKFHPESIDIHETLEDLMVVMKEDGYVAELDCLLLDEE